MNVTFLIGNGFDLNLGLKTRYIDYLPYFMSEASQDNIIKKWISENEQKWADLELQLGREMRRLRESGLTKYYRDKNELDLLLLRYLNEQQSMIDTRNEIIVSEFVRSLKDYSKVLPDAQRDQISRIKSAYRDEPFIYRFISFNYTTILDDIVSSTKKKNPVGTHTHTNGQAMQEEIGDVFHVHGTINSDMILGLNDISQINNKNLQSNEEFISTIIKSRMNDGVANNTDAKAKGIIDKSGIIIIFGMSLGETDKMWWEHIVRWLNNDNHRLIIYTYAENEDIIRQLPAQRNLERNRVLDSFFSKGRTDQSDALIKNFKNRTYVVFSKDIFHYENITLNKGKSKKQARK